MEKRGQMAELSNSQIHTDSDGEPADESCDYTLVRFAVPIEEFALHDTLITLPDAEFEGDQTVETPNGSLMPLIWARGVDRIDLERALEEDASVRQATLIEDHGSEMQYRMEWGSRLRVLARMLSPTGSLIRDVYGTRNGWTLQVLYPSRSHLSEVSVLCKSLDIEITINAIRRLEGGPEDQYGLTANQLEALAVAHEMGYFEIPRATDLDAVAEELGLSHQSLSERLRRAHDALIQNTIRDRNHG